MPEPTRDHVDALRGNTLLEFGATWCPICQDARPNIDAALADAAHVRHLRIEDGKGRPLGRSFGVKLWPTLILMVDGRELGRVVRPTSEGAVRTLLQRTPPIDEVTE